jgi:sortase A
MARLYDEAVRALGGMRDDRRMATTTLERPPRTPRRGRGPSFWIGTGLILAGLAVLGYVAWQFFGTNFVAAQKQRSIVEKTEQSWRAEGGAGAAAQASPARLGGASALIRVPRFGKNYVMPVQEGVSDRVLAEGYGHFSSSAKAGAVGNYALAAHRVTHGEPLRKMPELRPGDEIVVETRTTTYTYELDTDPNKLIVTFAGTWVVDPLPTNPVDGGVQPAQRRGQRLITLTTCSELFHTDNRMIAFGHLVDATPR